MIRPNYLIALLLILLTIGSSQAAEPSSNPSVKLIQRTMRSLAGERNPGEKIRILFYGQSITAQRWRDHVVTDLKKRFAEANLEIQNRAIGGFQSPALRRTAEHDLYPFYPDLLIFHVYGDLAEYEAIIRKVRDTTTAEIVLWTDHVAHPDRMDRDDQYSEGIRRIAQKHDCMLVDVRKAWKQHLADSGKAASDFLRDSVHLNAAGEKLLGDIIKAELLRTNEHGENGEAEAQILDVPLDSDAVTIGENGEISLSFEGNRVVALSDGSNPSSELAVRLDGREMKTFAGAWAATRPSKSANWMPAIRHVALGEDPVAETWTVTCLPDSAADGTKIHFRLSGSVTGDDGEGWSTEDFVSNSGRIRIARTDWNIAFPLKLRKMSLPENFQVRWKVYPLFTGTFAPGEKAAENMLVQGIPNGKHTLTITPTEKRKPIGIQKFKIYRPQAALARSQHLVRKESWHEMWSDGSGGFEEREVTAEIWTAAMQASLDGTGSLHIPARDLPYYIDGPLILKSGHRITADPEAEIRLKPGCNTCMVRNLNLVGFKDGPVPDQTKPDIDIHIEGGIWTTLATAKNQVNGNARGHSSRQNWVFGTHGVILLQNARRISVKNVTVRKSKPFAIHLGNVHEFEIDGLTLEDHYRDGVHVNGPASQGTIRNVRGNSHDDPVALNAWEWKNYAPTYGPIRDVLVENVTGASSGTNAIRLLPGVKRFDDGTELDCFLENITLRHITDIREFKIYDQPNLEMGRDKDFSIGVGAIRKLRFEDLVFNRPGKIELHANTDGLVIRDVLINHPIVEDWHLLAIGPKSMTWNRAKDPANWKEVFSPDLDCTVRNLTVSGIRLRDSKTDLSIDRVVEIIEQKLNPDYPKTTPKGGRGKGIWIR